MMTTEPLPADDATAARLARLAARRGTATGAPVADAPVGEAGTGPVTPALARAPRRRPTAAAASRVLVTGAALAGTGAMVTTMALDEQPAAPPAPTTDPAQLIATPVAPTPTTAPPVVIVIRRVPAGSSGGASGGSTAPSVAASTPAPAPAPARAPAAPAASTRSGGS
jgi:hypothetical protein